MPIFLYKYIKLTNRISHTAKQKNITDFRRVQYLPYPVQYSGGRCNVSRTYFPRFVGACAIRAHCPPLSGELRGSLYSALNRVTRYRGTIKTYNKMIADLTLKHQLYLDFHYQQEPTNGTTVCFRCIQTYDAVSPRLRIIFTFVYQYQLCKQRTNTK